jgi:hypothetical protein
MSPRTFVLCLIATAGCGSADPFAEIDAAECALIVRCGGGTADDEAACRSAYADHRARVAYSVNDAIASGRAEVDGARRGDCIASIRDADCVARSYDRCWFVVRGNVPPGGACQADMDCTDGFCERPLSYPIDGCDGVCRAYPKHGEPCTTRCVPTDYCEAATKTCMTRKPAGATCVSGECALGLQCIESDGQARCRGPGQQGQPCTRPQTVEATCASGLYCAGAGTELSGTCEARAGEGAACTTTLGCRDGLRCIGADNGTAVCAQPLADGATCASTPAVGEPGCRLTLSCDPASHRCVRPPAPEQRTCSSEFDCQTTFGLTAYYCDTASHACKRRAVVGESCAPQQLPSASCEQGVCDPTSHTCILVCS